MHLILLNLILFGISSANNPINGNEFCSTTVQCIEKVKHLVPSTNSYWFGDQYKLLCGMYTNSRSKTRNPINCYNPNDLIGFHSLGSRLFRVKTFTSAYLQNLKVFPRITFKPKAGNYHACGHDFEAKPEFETIEGHPEMDPAEPYFLNNEPEISWPEMDKNDSLIILMVDVGFGKLRFLSINFPRDTTVIQKYRPIENFRYDMPTPMVVLIFRPPTNVVFDRRNFKGHPDAPFDLTEFMMKHGLENGLIGMNWVIVGSDPFAIERARLKSIADNCHFLIQKKLLSDRRWPFAESFPPNEMDALMTVSFNQPSFQEQVCCSDIDLPENEVYADPLSDAQLPSIAITYPPKVTSLRSIQQADDNYQRSLRHYIVSKEDRFTLVMFDPKKLYLYWLVSDIPADYLAPGDIIKDSLTIAKYLAPVPEKPNECQFIVLMLFRQPRSTTISEISEHYNSDHPLQSKLCKDHCIYRTGFAIEQFKSFHGLTLSSISWFKVCYDVYEASKQIKKIKESNQTEITPPEKSLSNPFKKPINKKKVEIEHICSMIRQTNIDCAKSPSTQSHLIQWYLILSSVIIIHVLKY